MRALARAYLDGDLNGEEARKFLEALANDPELNHEVAALEEVVALGSELPGVSDLPGFSTRVMATIESGSRSGGRTREVPRSWRPGLALAASWALAIGLGYILATGVTERIRVPGLPGDEGAGVVASGSAVDAAAAGSRLPQVVRLVYAASGSEVSRVAVAGSFNNWDPANTPMRLENRVWVAMLLLPADSYEYMFVENDETWVTDPLAPKTRADGFGRRNAVLDVGI